MQTDMSNEATPAEIKKLFYFLKYLNAFHYFPVKDTQ